MLFAQIAAGQGDWPLAKAQFQTYASKTKISFNDNLIYQWTLAISNNNNSIDLSGFKPKQSKNIDIISYLNSSQLVPANALTIAADDRCDKTVAHFYTAMRYWLKGDKSNSKKHLEYTIKQGASFYSENAWARVMLSSLF